MDNKITIIATLVITLSSFIIVSTAYQIGYKLGSRDAFIKSLQSITAAINVDLVNSKKDVYIYLGMTKAFDIVYSLEKNGI